ncbi:unnamed protein product [Thelazia callipaeda]|uniref:Uncharacterized protein n=1 Tax=Thelazia callipaeda TaxID=103827 RepID=A0A0N5CTW0_THECL|nr:unnamed protein product [Thelazia callipaeda]
MRREKFLIYLSFAIDSFKLPERNMATSRMGRLTNFVLMEGQIIEISIAHDMFCEAMSICAVFSVLAGKI